MGSLHSSDYGQARSTCHGVRYLWCGLQGLPQRRPDMLTPLQESLAEGREAGHGRGLDGQGCHRA